MLIPRFVFFNICGILLFLGACAKSVPIPEPIPMPGHNEVWYQASEFRPRIITVPVGTTVTWINKDKQVHTVTSENGLFNGTMEPLGSYGYTFTENGTFDYFDTYDAAHREWAGTVYVQ